MKRNKATLLYTLLVINVTGTLTLFLMQTVTFSGWIATFSSMIQYGILMSQGQNENVLNDKVFLCISIVNDILRIGYYYMLGDYPSLSIQAFYLVFAVKRFYSISKLGRIQKETECLPV